MLAAVSTISGLISSVYRDFHHWRSNQRPQIAASKLYDWATNTYCTQVTPNQFVMVTARPIKLNVTSVLFTEDTVTSRATSSQEDGKYASALLL